MLGKHGKGVCVHVHMCLSGQVCVCLLSMYLRVLLCMCAHV